MGYKISRTKNVQPVEPGCKKTIYHTLEDAQEMIRFLKENRTSKEIKAYRCEFCGFWHLTSKTG